MALLAIHQPDARTEARLSSALAAAHDVRVEPTWESLRSKLRSGAVEACVLDADHPDRSTAANRLSMLADRHPDVAVVVSVPPGAAATPYRLGGLGVDGIVIADSPSSAIRSEVDAALARACGRIAERLLRERIGDPGPGAIAWAIEHAGSGASVDGLAAALATTPAGLRTACRNANLPSPAKILLWGRLILAGARLHRDRRGVEEVAFSLGYATSTSLARAMKLHTGRTPVDVARAEGMCVVLDALVDRLTGTA